MDGRSETERVETVVVGGGQAGLAVGRELAKRGQRFVILDASERVGDTWRRRWDSLRLFTPARYDGLPGWRFPAPGWSFPTKDEMADGQPPSSFGGRRSRDAFILRRARLALSLRRRLDRVECRHCASASPGGLN